MRIILQPKFLLVSGTMRSGTTLMGELLYSRAYSEQRHPALSFANDNFDFLRKFLFSVREYINPGLHKAHPFGRLYIYENDYLERQYSNLKGDSVQVELLWKELTERIFEISPISNYQHLRVIGLKSTGITVEIDILRKLFSQTKMIVMLRDPRDLLSSNIKRAGEKRVLDGRSVIATLLNYYYFIANRQNDADILSVRYEDMIANPPYIIKTVFSFIGLDVTFYDWSSLTENRIASNSSYMIDKQQVFSLNAGITDKSIGKFHEILSDFEILAVEKLLGPFMDQYGYHRCRQNTSGGFEKKYIIWLSQIYKGSKLLGISNEGLRCRMQAQGLSNCFSEFEDRIEIGSNLLIGNTEAWDRINQLLADSITNNPKQEESVKEVFDKVLAYADNRNWYQVEKSLAEGLCGEQNWGRLFRMCYNFLFHYKKIYALFDYLNWCFENQIEYKDTINAKYNHLSRIHNSVK